MIVVIGSDNTGVILKDLLIKHLKQQDYEVVDATREQELDFVDATLAVTQALKQHKDALAIAIDAYGVGSFITATKIPGIIAAEVSDERSAYMTRAHNNCQLITLGSEIVGDTLTINIVEAFLTAGYDGGRHQIRVDMLNQMC